MAPPKWKEVYLSDITSIIDGTELRTEVPSALEAQKSTFSHYKKMNTAKFLNAITPGGAAMYSSEAFPGSVKDTNIVTCSGFVDFVEKNECHAADRGFQGAAEAFTKKGARVLYPPMKTREEGFTSEESVATHSQANLRIHVERAYARVKRYRYFDHKIPVHHLDILGKLFRITYLAVNNYHLPLTEAGWSSND
jgi:hypothetical protein